MASIGVNAAEFEKELEALGIDEVRIRLETKIYGDLNEKGGLARAWVLRKELAANAELRRLNDAATQKQIEIACSAKNAAWTAAICAIVAVPISLVAVAISIWMKA